MVDTNKEIMHLVNLGREQKIRGKYDAAHNYYYQALEYNPQHRIVRNAIAELLFINRKYLAAADNFYIAAIDHSYQLDLDFITIEDTSKKSFFILKEHGMTKAENLLTDYAVKIGFSLFAHQFDNPIAKTAQQAAINSYRNKLDPYGYSNFIDIDPIRMEQINNKAKGFGYDYMDTMNQKQDHQSDTVFPLKQIMDFFNVKY